jgi:hypothetical protein
MSDYYLMEIPHESKFTVVSLCRHHRQTKSGARIRIHSSEVDTYLSIYRTTSSIIRYPSMYRPSLIITTGIRRWATPLTLACNSSFQGYHQQAAKRLRTTTIFTTTNIRKANMSYSSPAVKVKSLDHVVLTVKSLEATADFYTTHLGMKHEKFTSGGVERYLSPNLCITAQNHTANITR